MPSMIPDHCKDVSLRQVDFPLTESNIVEKALGMKAYTRTDYMVLRHGNDTAVIRVEKAKGKELFRDIVDIEIVSLPSDSVFIEDEGIDVLNVSQMAEQVVKNDGKTVVVSGMFNHVSFLKVERVLRLRILDVVPPSPSKLSVLVDRALSTGLVELPIVPLVEDIDLNEMEARVRTEAVMFPCRASGLRSCKKVFYLDETPELDLEEVTLVGCDLSRRIFRSVYGYDPESVDMCPKNLVMEEGVPTIIKCCKVKQGHEVHGSIAMVPWGATTLEVAAALNALFSDRR
jgi:hypothetical protein